MRTVYRTSVAAPQSLLNWTSVAAATAAYTATGNVTNRLYQSQDVDDSLRILYLEKCYLCERDAHIDGLVEHFLPHHRQRAGRAFEWSNLHWSCPKCNGRKIGKAFKRLDEKTTIVAATLLLNPCDPPTPVEQIITYDDELRAIPTQAYRQDQITLKTARFLNHEIPHGERESCFRRLADLIFLADCRREWETLIRSESLDIEQFNVDLRDSYVHAMDFADRLYLNFLTDAKPFCTSMRCVVENRLRLSVTRMRDIGRAHRVRNGLPQIY